MVPKHVYETLDPEEQKLWHSHEFEVKSGMLVLPTPSSHQGKEDEWEKMETEAMKEVIGLYGKTWHFWQVDKGHELPLGESCSKVLETRRALDLLVAGVKFADSRVLGYPKLMGSLTSPGQLDLDHSLADRNARFGVNHHEKAKKRADIQGPGVHKHSDSWWKEASQ